MENSKATDVDGPRADNGAPLNAPARSASQITLTFSFEDHRWMLKPSHDGALAGDDPEVRPAVMKLRNAVEHVQAIAAVRRELEQAAVATQHLSAQQVAQLGRRVSQAAPALRGAQG
jgi:hypothetical protein